MSGSSSVLARRRASLRARPIPAAKPRPRANKKLIRERMVRSDALGLPASFVVLLGRLVSSGAALGRAACFDGVPRGAGALIRYATIEGSHVVVTVRRALSRAREICVAVTCARTSRYRVPTRSSTMAFDATSDINFPLGSVTRVESIYFLGRPATMEQGYP